MALRFTLRQLEYFVAVGNAGSIARAASRVNVSSPSISTAISQLEDEFGLSLFVREHARGLSLTPAGNELMKHAEKLLIDAKQLNNLANIMSGNIRGQLRIGCLLTFAHLVLPGIRRTFEHAHPDVRITQMELHQLEIFEHLRRAEIDLALSYDLDIPTDLAFLPLLELPPYALVNTTHPLAESTTVSITDLQDLPMILLDLPHSSSYFISLFSKVGAKPVIAERTKDMAVMRSLVANGFGYSIANTRPQNDHSPDGKKLRFIPLSGDVRPMKLGIITRDGAQDTLTVKAFVEHCKTSITDENLPGINIARQPHTRRR
ncbi:LysR family transcriptional regulator [Marinosulfonomonas sp. PRT-SC04]|nr:LysR family transcriptional regulator [Marinosulfonomonas sp. PRT-SC04]